MSMETYNESKHSLDTAYLVVIFVNTDEVAVIPHNWLLSSGECMWPRYQTQMKTNKAVINKTQPDDTWKAYKIKIVAGSGKLKFLYGDIFYVHRIEMLLFFQPTINILFMSGTYENRIIRI